MNHLVILIHFMTVTTLHCLLSVVGYRVDIIELVTSIKHLSPPQLFHPSAFTSLPKRYASTMLPPTFQVLAVSFEIEPGRVVCWEPEATEIVPFSTVQGIMATG